VAEAPMPRIPIVGAILHCLIALGTNGKGQDGYFLQICGVKWNTLQGIEGRYISMLKLDESLSRLAWASRELGGWESYKHKQKTRTNGDKPYIENYYIKTRGEL